MIERDKIVERAKEAAKLDAEQEQGTNIETLCKELIESFAEVEEDREVYDALQFIQAELGNEPPTENSPLHALMNELGKDDELFQRMNSFVKREKPHAAAAADSD